MSTQIDGGCLRCRDDCVPIAAVAADKTDEHGNALSFICVGFNRPEDRSVAGDRFTLCWKNAGIDERGHWDKRDLLDTMSVIAQALSVDENIRVTNGFNEREMQEANMML